MYLRLFIQIDNAHGKAKKNRNCFVRIIMATSWQQKSLVAFFYFLVSNIMLLIYSCLIDLLKKN
jgi:hypothetical protein